MDMRIDYSDSDKIRLTLFDLVKLLLGRTLKVPGIEMRFLLWPKRHEET